MALSSHTHTRLLSLFTGLLLLAAGSAQAGGMGDLKARGKAGIASLEQVKKSASPPKPAKVATAGEEEEEEDEDYGCTAECNGMGPEPTAPAQPQRAPASPPSLGKSAPPNSATEKDGEVAPIEPAAASSMIEKTAPVSTAADVARVAAASTEEAAPASAVVATDAARVATAATEEAAPANAVVATDAAVVSAAAAEEEGEEEFEGCDDDPDAGCDASKLLGVTAAPAFVTAPPAAQGPFGSRSAYGFKDAGPLAFLEEEGAILEEAGEKSTENVDGSANSAEKKAGDEDHGIAQDISELHFDHAAHTSLRAEEPAEGVVLVLSPSDDGFEMETPDQTPSAKKARSTYRINAV